VEYADCEGMGGNNVQKNSGKEKEEEFMKEIKVAAAIICDNVERIKKIFATQRGYGKFQGNWEFPGGKMEPEETPEQALKREILEELDTEIEIGKQFDMIQYDYPDFHLTMYCFLSTVKSGNLILREHKAAKWLTRETINSVQWLPADLDLIEKLKSIMK
jgi:8-oxo-dGTP diphosphatase